MVIADLIGDDQGRCSLTHKVVIMHVHEDHGHDGMDLLAAQYAGQSPAQDWANDWLVRQPEA